MEDGTAKNHMSRYSSNYHHHHHQTPSSHRSKHPTHITSYNQQVTDDYGDDDDEDDSEDEELEDIDQENMGEEEDEYEEEMYQKKRKWKSLSPGYEYTPRVPEPPVVAQWTEHTTSMLLDVWGDKILQHGRKSLRAEEWNEVAKKVSQLARMLKTDTQCRHRLDTLKKKYKKEKSKVEGDNGYVSKWVHFKKMDTLMMSSSSKQREGLACGLDSGEYVFMNSDVYLNCSNGMDEMRDSPENSESSDGEKRRINGDGDEGFSSSSFRLLADSIQKFGEIYQKIEESKRLQMQELEKMRMEFHRDLELQKRQMLEQAQAEIEKLQQSNGDDDRDDDEDGDEVDVSAENRSE